MSDEKEPQPSEEYQMPEANDEYQSGDLEHLSDLEHVRERPSMYIGDTTIRGLHHLVYEVVDNSIDEAMAGFASDINVKINIEGSITVEDNGRGIPVEKHEQLSEQAGREVSTLEGVMTVLKFGGKFSKGAYQTSGGLHGVGVTVVNFLSEWAEVEVYRDGHVYQQEYERGVPVGEVRRIGKTDKVGTKTTFKPDPQIFPVTKFTYTTLHKRLQELAFLNRGARITITDDRSKDTETFEYEQGIIEYVKHLNRSSEPAHEDILYFSGQQDGIEVEIAIQYSSEFTENVHTYVNNISTHEGGTHLSGFRASITRTINNYGKKEKIFRDLVPSGDDFREGLTAVISLRHPHPQFEGQTKTKLGNSEVEGIVNSLFGDFLSGYLEEHPRTAKVITNKGVLAAEARESARKARQLIRDRKGVLTGGGLPGKLRDCSSKRVDICELYLVEGDSAGGSAEGGRFREYQAILPLRGKIINAFKAREDKVLANAEIRSMISAVGAGIGDEMDLTKRRYGKIVVMTDADIDGSHIRTLLLTFFYRQMYPLVKAGYVYLAMPPLFRVKSKKNVQYVQSEEEMKTQLLELGQKDAVFDDNNGRLVEGEAMKTLCRTVAALDEALIALERRGISVRDHAARLDSESGKLPIYHVFVGRKDHWFSTRKQLDDFLSEAEKAAGGELAVSDAPLPEENGDGDENGTTTPESKLHIVELHEVRTINTMLKDLTEQGFRIDDLLPEERTGMEGSRYTLRRGENETGLDDLRGLVPAIRAAGEKGLTITRFKGLGEMNAEELRDTTLDPENRTLQQVTMRDAGAADELFRTLMGDKVEPRREYIEKYALDVKNLDV
jgi:DNA gyrase subunit B